MADPVEEVNGALTVGAYKLGSIVARLTPAPIAQGVVSMFAPGLAISLRKRRSMVERHLRRVDPSLNGWKLRRASQQAFESYMRYYAESFALPSMSAAQVARTFVVENFHHVDDALAKGNGVILALPHLGGWEWAGRWLADRGYKVAVVVEALDPPELFEWFVGLRKSLGMNVIPLGPSAAAQVLTALRNNEIVCLLSDRDIQGGGVEVTFFGEKTTLPAGPAMLGLRANSVILPVATYFTDKVNGHRAVVRPPLPMERTGGLRESVGVITQLLANELEELIREAPEQWHLFQPNWPSDPGYDKN